MRKVNTEIVTPETFQGWSKLEPNEQTKVTVEFQALEKAIGLYEMSNLEIGEHLNNVSKVLTPKRMFNKWLSWWLKGRKRKLSRSWAYQMMKDYGSVKVELPKPVLEMALQRGTKISVAAIAKNPPPKEALEGNKSAIGRYLDSLKTTKVEVIKSRDTLVKEVLNLYRKNVALLPDGKSKAWFLRTVIGMEMTVTGLASEQNYAPMAVPETAKRGRPTLKKAA
jgi:hypothetical protein